MPVSDYHYEQTGRRPLVLIAVALAGALTAVGLIYGAPSAFLAVTAVSGMMAAIIYLQNSTSGMRLEGDRIVLYKDAWRAEFDLRTVRRVRTTAWTDGQPDVWLEFDQAPA